MVHVGNTATFILGTIFNIYVNQLIISANQIPSNILLQAQSEYTVLFINAFQFPDHFFRDGCKKKIITQNRPTVQLVYTCHYTLSFCIMWRIWRSCWKITFSDFMLPFFANNHATHRHWPPAHRYISQHMITYAHSKPTNYLTSMDFFLSSLGETSSTAHKYDSLLDTSGDSIQNIIVKSLNQRDHEPTRVLSIPYSIWHILN